MSEEFTAEDFFMAAIKKWARLIDLYFELRDTPKSFNRVDYDQEKLYEANKIFG
jgi:hypothetical protein